VKTITGNLLQEYKEFVSDSQTLEGMQILILANLVPRVIRGVESQGMILAAHCERGEGFSLLVPTVSLPNGSKVS